MSETHTFTKGEEIANAITHGIGAILSIVALVLLIVTSAIHGTSWHIVSFTLFGCSMLLMYTCSTMLHSLPAGKAKDIFEILDHSSIYYFIAGTYTPFLFLIIQGWLGWTIFGIVWGLAIAGTVFKSFFAKKFVFYSTLLYVLMGWLIVFAWKPIYHNLHSNGIALLVVGGLLYTLGSVFYVWRGFKFHHTLWHLFVIGGSMAHFFCVYLYLI
ncbi:PAQR family membrane homeostasis protein TrhA [Robertmurraya kyonggiensis]|uniref:Hemolysin III family protein n=1 Tax=Robertmurraya kyonggiensis TaxID=1037680 RepID=A0A4U1D776_9BACI|nr:hemolysin III family protein [Robertmurraya kyonggiensis]TKC18402.1 hemolysin III family protein [Robertmurraya kyonggiensis]